ncbi:pyrroloquinoline quinone biosynthesis protein B, partial [Pseudomonas sp. BN414]|nr:pyrroloquinoline quinone biosynthesis protein B [Pseudomonas sp. BN414]
MHIQILGSAAGGGFPQWNCNCRNCAGVRSGKVRAQPRSQSSIALSANGVDWVLCNASPDIRAQLDAFPP